MHNSKKSPRPIFFYQNCACNRMWNKTTFQPTINKIFQQFICWNNIFCKAMWCKTMMLAFSFFVSFGHWLDFERINTMEKKWNLIKQLDKQDLDDGSIIPYSLLNSRRIKPHQFYWNATKTRLQINRGMGGMKIDNKSYLGSDVNHLGGADGGQMSNQVWEKRGLHLARFKEYGNPNIQQRRPNL